MESIKHFLSIDSEIKRGYGYGFGDGSGDGSGYGYGSGDGDEMYSINGDKVYIIDDVQTILRTIHGNFASGFILNSDLTLTPTFVCKGNNLFAHGDTIHTANQALRDKIMDTMSEDDRIILFKKEFPYFDKAYPNKDLFTWHHTLTGSCEQGRKSFAKNHGIDVDKGSMTIYEFIELTKNSYGGKIIENLLSK